MNYNDVLQALNTGHVAAVGTDVYCIEPFPTTPFLLKSSTNTDTKDEVNLFLSHQNVICTPHIAGVTEISYRNMAKILSENVIRLINGHKPLGVVNSIATRSCGQ